MRLRFDGPAKVSWAGATRCFFSSFFSQVEWRKRGHGGLVASRHWSGVSVRARLANGGDGGWSAHTFPKKCGRVVAVIPNNLDRCLRSQLTDPGPLGRKDDDVFSSSIFCC